MLLSELPAEIIARVIDYVVASDANESSGRHPLSPLAVISRSWQSAIEFRTFRILHVKSTELRVFRRICQQGQRQQAIQELHYAVVFAIPSVRKRRATGDLVHNDKHDMDHLSAVRLLFGILQTWLGGSVSDACPMPKLKLHLRIINGRSDDHHEDLQDLPSNANHPNGALGRIISLDLTNGDHCLRLAGAAPVFNTLAHLEILCLQHKDDDQAPLSSRQLSAKTLSSLSFPHLRLLTLTFIHKPIDNHNHPPPPLSPPGTPDPLSTSLHTISLLPTLTSIHLTGSPVLSKDLFWSTDSSPPYGSDQTSAGAENYWPSLETYHVSFCPAAPDGTWYFERDVHGGTAEVLWDVWAENEESEGDVSSESGSSDDELVDGHVIHIFWSVPTVSTLNPLLVAMARAARRMPRLWSMSLDCVTHPEMPRFGVRYNARTACKTSSGKSRVGPRLEWTTGGLWRPGGDVLDEWKSHDRFGNEDLTIEYLI